MKLENCNIGDIVKVKKSNKTFGDKYIGCAGMITGIDISDQGGLSVRVVFSKGEFDYDWGSHKDLKLIEKSTVSHYLETNQVTANETNTN